MVPQGGIRHPMNRNTLYTPDDDMTVVITAGDQWGRFTWDGRHVEGPLFEADPELCLWVASKRPVGHHRLARVVEMPAER